MRMVSDLGAKSANRRSRIRNAGSQILRSDSVPTPAQQGRSQKRARPRPEIPCLPEFPSKSVATSEVTQHAIPFLCDQPGWCWNVVDQLCATRDQSENGRREFTGGQALRAKLRFLRAPESAHQQWGGSPHRTEHWLSVVEGNCVVERRGGKQPETNCQSINKTMLNTIRPDALASLRRKSEAQNRTPTREGQGNLGNLLQR
jgi:hypothetical protein